MIKNIFAGILVLGFSLSGVSQDMSKVLKPADQLPPATKGKCLDEGSIAPNFTADLVNGKKLELYKSLEKKNVVLVFYRGGWCPFCNFQLRAYEDGLKTMDHKNFEMLAISADKINPELSISDNKTFSFNVASDPKLSIISKYNVEFKVPEKLVTKYKNSYKIDLEKASGEKHHKIAVPAIVIIDKSKKIKWCYANENHRIRPALEVVKKKLLELK